MTVEVGEIRALLALFARSPWHDLHVRTGEWTIFLAKPGGGANPMQAEVPTAADDRTVAVTAPHLGLFKASLPVGYDVAVGTIIGQIDVLGEPTDIACGTAGRIASIVAADGALVEYGEPLVRIAAV
jgi:biotin carboxyl carrier protein